MEKDKQLRLPFSGDGLLRGSSLRPSRSVATDACAVESLSEYRKKKVAAENAKLDAAIIARARHLLR